MAGEGRGQARDHGKGEAGESSNLGEVTAVSWRGSRRRGLLRGVEDGRSEGAGEVSPPRRRARPVSRAQGRSPATSWDRARAGLGGGGRRRRVWGGVVDRARARWELGILGRERRARGRAQL